MPEPCQNVSGQKFIQEMLIYNIMLKKSIYTVIYAYVQNRGISSLLVGMAVCNTFFNKEASKLITYQSRESVGKEEHMSGVN